MAISPFAELTLTPRSPTINQIILHIGTTPIPMLHMIQLADLLYTISHWYIVAVLRARNGDVFVVSTKSRSNI